MGGSGSGRCGKLGTSFIILTILLSLFTPEDAEARRRGGARRPRGQQRGARAAAARGRRGGGGARRRQQANNNNNNNNNNDLFRLRDSAFAGNFFVNPVVVDPSGFGDDRFSRNVVLVNGVPTVLSGGQISNGQVVNPVLGDQILERRNGQLLPGVSANGTALNAGANADIQIINQGGR